MKKTNPLFNSLKGHAFIVVLFVLMLICGQSWGQTTRYWKGSGTWTSANQWALTSGGTYTTTWISNDVAVFDVASSTVTFASTGVTGITANQNVTFTAGGTLTTNATQIPISVASGMTLDLAGQNISTVAGTGIIKNGTGTLISSNGNAYPGGFTLNAGTMIIGGVNALGSGGALNINGGVLASSSPRNITTRYSALNIGGDFTFGASSYIANITFADNVSLGSATRTINFAGTAGTSTYTFSGIISGTSSAGISVGTTSGNGILVLSGVNTYPGATTITSGELRLNPSGNLSLGGACTFNGGKLSTAGIASTRTITFSSINISDNSTLALLASSDHRITFTSKGTFSSGKTLTITGWTGSYILGTTGAVTAAGKVFIGNSATLTSSELAQIIFNNGTNNYAATQLSSGEIIPTTQLIVSTIANQTTGIGFSVTITAKDLDGNARNLTNTTGVILSTLTGGTISGTITGSIVTGTNSVTISGVTLTAGTSQKITATRSSGDMPVAGISNSFDVSAIAPTVTTDAAPSVIAATAATMGGNVTATGGANITGNGIVYSLTGANATPTISGSSVTQLANPSPGTSTGTFSLSNAVALAVNSQYSYRAYATNSGGTSYGGGTGTTFYTLANVPSAPTVNNASSSTLDVAVNVNGNPAATEFAIKETGGLYVQSNGTLSASAVWQTAATWSSTITVNGLAAFTTYTFEVKARNGAATETAFGATASLSTLSGSTPAITVGALAAFGSQCINSTYGPNNFTISGVNLTADVSIAALDGYTYSITPGGSYSTTLTITQSGGSLSQTVSVKFTPTAVQSYNGSISVGGGGAATVTTSVTASGVNTSPTISTPTSASVSNTSAVLGGNISSIGCSNVTERGIYYSISNGFADGEGTKVAETGSFATATFTISVSTLTPTTTYYYKAFATNSGGIVYTSQASFSTLTPTITVASVTAFGSQTVNTTSTEKSYAVSGANLTNDILITPPSGFEISTTSGSGFATSTITLTQSGGNVSSTIYVIFKPTAVTSYSANITHTSVNASSQNVALSGSGTAPANPATFTATTTSSSQINLAATANANSDNIIAVYSSTASFTPPIQGVASGNPGDAFAGGVIVYKGNAASLSNHTALSANTLYYYKTFSYDALNYYSSGSTASATTSKIEPSNQVTNFAKGAVTTSAIPLSWTSAATGSQAPDGYLLKLNTATVTAPVDGTDPTDTTVITSGAANKKIAGGTSTSTASFTTMTAGTMYHYKIYSYTNTGSLINFNTISPTSLDVATLPNAVTSPIFTVGGATTSTISWTAATGYDNTNHSTLVFVKAGSAVTMGTPTNAPTNYAENAVFGSGTAFQNDASAFCVYKGDGNTAPISGLAPNTAYYVLIYTVVDASNSDLSNSYSAGATVSATTSTLPATTATAATAVTSSGFTANWNAEAGASSYRLDVGTTSSFVANIISENFGGFTTNLGSADRSGSLNTYLQTLGWTGAAIYEMVGYSKLGSSSARGIITTPTIDLSANSGSATLYFDLGLYGSDNTLVQVYHAADGTNFSQVGGDITPTVTLTTQTIAITGGTSISKIRIQAKNASNYRFYLDNILIQNSAILSSYNNITVGSTSTVVTTLSPNTNYYYRVRAYNATSTSPNSNVITALTTPAAATATVTVQLSCVTSTATVVITAPLGAYEYNIDGGSYTSTTTFTGLAAGNHDILVRSATVTSSISVATTVTVNAQPVSPVAALSSSATDNTICAGSTVSFTASGGNSYEFFVGAVSQGAASSTTTFVTPSLTNLQVVTVKVGNTSGCYTTSSGITTTVHAIPTVSSASVSPASVCVSGTVSFTATPSSGSIEWYDAVSGGSIVVSPPTTISSTTTLYAEATANGCVSLSRSTVTATVYDLPVPVITGDAAVCAGTTSSVYSVTEVAGHTYSWTVTGGSITSGGTTNSITVDWGVAAAATVDVIEGIATVSCTASAVQKAVTITALPTANISYTGSPYCLTLSAPQSVSLSGSTGGSFSAVSGLSLDAVNGSFTPSTSTAATYTITYTIAATGGCNAFTATTSVQITTCYTLTISKTGADGVGGRITSSPAGIDCGSTCSYLFPAGTTVVLTSTPIASATFSGWSGAATGTSSTASIDMTNNKSVAARFTYSLTVSKTGSGSGTVTSTPAGISCGATCAASYDAGSLVSLSASAAPGSVFSGWSGAATGTSTSNAISMESNQTAYAEFTCLLPATPGTISGTATVCSGTSQTYSIEAVPNTTSYTWSLPSGWIGSSSNNSITATAGLNGNISVVANNACGSGTAQTLSVTVTQLPTAAISYTASPWCTSASVQTVSLTASESGSFTASPSGLTIDAVNGTITPSTTTAGTYTVTYTIAAAGACSAVTASDIVTITALPTASISYSASPWCTSASAQTVSLNGTTGGSYTSTSGLSLNTSTGEITPASSSAGTYTVTYTIAAAGGCDAVISTANVHITAAPIATIAYTGTPYCTSIATEQAVTHTGTTGGAYTATPGGLIIDASTGAITPSTSSATTYTVTYTIAASGGCVTLTATTNVTITTLPTATISYSGSPWCASSGSPSIALPGTSGGSYGPSYYPGGTKIVSFTGTHGGEFTATPGGLSINASSGAITPASSAGGTYTVTYTLAAAGGCATVTATTNVTITTLPTAAISYSGSPFCTSASAQSVSFSGTSGGTYTSTSGLSLNTSAGEITPTSSTAGTYTVTYTIAAAGGCAAVNAMAGLSITALPTASISYSGSPMCTSASAQTVSFTGTVGGTFTSTSGLSINTSTGEITPATSTAGTYTVTYTIAAAGGCEAVIASTSVTITTLPTAAISYSGSPYCTSASAQSVSFSGTSGGTYTSTSGLSLDTSTGEITPASSSAGTYTVTYTIAAAGGCAAVNATAGLIINTLPTATISYSGSPMCTSASAQTVSFTGTTGGTYTSTSGLSINTSTGEITPASSTAGTYTVTYTIAASGGCSAVTASVSVSVIDLPSQPSVSVIQPSCVTSTATVSVTSSLTGLHFSKNAVDYSNTTGVFSGLSAASTYSITARNDYGCVSPAATGSINIQPLTPPAPTANAASSISSTGFTANWSTVSPPGWAAGSGVSYFMDVSTSNTFTSFVTGYNNLAIASGITKLVSGLTANTTYYYRIRSQYYSLCASVNSNVITVTTLGPPTLTTIAISSVLTVSASSGGNITADGGSAVTAKGVCWSTSPAPTTASSTLTTDGSGTAGFTSNITGLIALTTYYVRAYATNGIGTAYGNEVSFMTASGSGTIVTNLANSGAGSLRDAIANVAEGGIITFADGLNGTITLATSLVINLNIFFDNHNLAIGTILGGSGACITINAGKTLTIKTGSKLTVTGGVLNNGGKGIAGLVIASGASFIHNTVDLQATVKRELNPAWHLFGSPFKQNTGSSLAALIPSGGNVQMMPYTNGVNWGSVVSSPYYYFLPTVGYAVKPSAAVTASLTGMLYYSPVDYTIPLIYNGTAATQSWNLVANPYTSYLNFNLLGKTNLNTSLYLWDNSLYPLYTPVTNAAYFRTYNSCNNVGVPAGTTPFIAPLQGFFVRGVYTAPKLSFIPSARVHSASPYYKEQSNTEILVRLKTESEQGMDELVICKNPAAKLDFEQFDSEKLFGGLPIEFYSQSASGEKLVINTINSTETIIPLGINGSAGAKGRITAFALESGEQLYLEDRLKAKIISLTENTSYDFEFPGDQIVGRFFIRFGAVNSSLTTSDVKVFVNENQLNVMAQTGEEIQAVEVFTVTGARVFKAEVGKTNVFTTDLQLSSAMYLVRVKTSLTTQNVKIRL
ncbi:MAG: hypothetical protein WCO13_09425 [Bacteroidota bacterium]